MGLGTTNEGGLHYTQSRPNTGRHTKENDTINCYGLPSIML